MENRFAARPRPQAAGTGPAAGVVAGWLAVLCCGLGSAGWAQGKLVEEQISLPVRVAGTEGRQVEHPIVVTLFYDDTAPKPYPVLVLNHGRSHSREKNLAMGRARYSAASGWFASLGFMVAVPTRVGYGVSGGEDVENSGSACGRKDYPPVYHAAAVQTLAVLDAVRARRDVSKNRAIVAGQSFGGTTAITLAAMNVAGVQATINFAGGGGGNPETRPQDPCSPKALERLFAGYGRTARIPTLWVYSQNDRYFAPASTRGWFDAFVAAGGKGAFALFPPVGDDGHSLFTRAPELWQPRVLEFLEPLGYRRRASR